MLTNKQFIILATVTKMNYPYLTDHDILLTVLDWQTIIEKVDPTYDIDWYCTQVMHECGPIPQPLSYLSFVVRMKFLYKKSFPNENKVHDKKGVHGTSSGF